VSDRAKRIAVVVFSVVFSLVAAGCSPEVGSDAWCEKMKEKPKGDWSANEATDFTKHCVFK
jgi:hypothetical protein